VIGGGKALGEPSPEVLSSKLILIATPDSAIESVAMDFSELGGKQWRGKVVLHTSGALDSSVLQPLADLGAATGSMHPMQTFSNKNIPDLAKCIFGIEGSQAALQMARKIVHQLNGVAVRLSGGNKAAYHASGSFACVYVLTLMETATRILMAQGFKRRQAMRALIPMTRQTLDNFERVGSLAAWTGPLARQDFSTIELHVRALAEMNPEYLKAYETLSRLTAKVLATKPGSTIKQLDRIYDKAVAATVK
jgi:predicted short-subunit dehydrogenase-like oxidoreductase (DUF2520 family)